MLLWGFFLISGVCGQTAALRQKKTNAIAVVRSYFKPKTKSADYKGVQLEKITSIKMHWIEVINAAKDEKAITDALDLAKQALDTVDTTQEAEQKAEALQAAKIEAVTALEAYFTPGTKETDYMDVQLERIGSIKDLWIEAINSAEDETAVTAALINAQEEIDNTRKQEWKKGLFVICILLVVSVIFIVIVWIS